MRFKGVILGVVLGGVIMLASGWYLGRQARHECEALGSGHPDAVQSCLAVRLLNGGA